MKLLLLLLTTLLLFSCKEKKDTFAEDFRAHVKAIDSNSAREIKVSDSVKQHHIGYLRIGSTLVVNHDYTIEKDSKAQAVRVVLKMNGDIFYVGYVVAYYEGINPNEVMLRFIDETKAYKNIRVKQWQ